MNDAEPLRLSCQEGVARITLSRPAQGNVIDLAMAKALLSAAIDCDSDSSLKCVILSAEGKLFSGGGDVRSFAAAGAEAPRLIKSITAHLHAAIATLARMNKPLVTVIAGPAAGAGLSLAVLGDIAIASRAARFSLAYAAVGLSPDGGASWLLPRLIGLRRAQELALTNVQLTADEAAELGLITRAVEAAELEGEVEKLVAQLQTAATAALGRTRQLLLASFQSTFETQMDMEATAISELMRTTDAREGVAAFLEKRKPRFGPS